MGHSPDLGLSKPVTKSRQRQEALLRLGIERYEMLREELARDHAGSPLAISAKTGSYRIAPNSSELTAFADSLTADDVIWMTRITAA